MDYINKIIQGDCLEVMRKLPDQSVNCVITSPPYFCVRDYGWNGQWGLEPTYNEYLEHLWSLMDEIHRILRDDGTVWINLGDSYSTQSGTNIAIARGTHKKQDSTYLINRGESCNLIKPKDLPSKCLLLIPHRFAIGCEDGINGHKKWIVRNDIIWASRNKMPESVTDRFSKKYEHMFFFVKSKKYFFDLHSILDSYKDNYSDRIRNKGAENWAKQTNGPSEGERNWWSKGGKNPGDVSDFWDIPTQPSSEKHYACVDDISECLTISGWKIYNEIKIGDIIASFNIKTNKLEWDICKDVHIYKEFNDTVLCMESPIVSFCATKNHRMVCTHRLTKSKRYSDYLMKQFKDINQQDRFPVTSEWIDGSFDIYNKNLSLELCELLGWITSEGHYNKYSIRIGQSLTVNTEKVERIEFLLKKLGYKYAKWIKTVKDNTVNYDRYYQYVEFGIAWRYAKDIFALMPDKRPKIDFILWSKEQIISYLNGIILGDGHIRVDSGRKSIVQKDKLSIDIFQIMVLRLGLRSIVSHRTDGCYVLYITNNKRTSARSTNNNGLKVVERSYKGVVWCPETNNGTFVCRRNGRIIITGNSFNTNLIDKPLIAGSPEFVCSKCGKPREKIFEEKEIVRTQINNYAEQTQTGGKSTTFNGGNNRKVIGLTDCGCGAEFVGGIVLDPFAGTSTTLVRAYELGRRYIGIEGKQEYVDISSKRLLKVKSQLKIF